MGFSKTINLDKEAYEIWERRFGAYSQGFSSWVSQKLKEDDLINIDPETRKNLIQKKKEDTLKELAKLETAEKETNIQIENKYKKNKEDIIKQKLEKEKAESLEKEKEKLKFQESLKLHKNKALELFEISKDDAEKVSEKYINEKNHGSFVKYFENLNFMRKKTN